LEKYKESPLLLIFLAQLYLKQSYFSKFLRAFRKIEDMNLGFRYNDIIQRIHIHLKGLYGAELH